MVDLKPPKRPLRGEPKLAALRTPTPSDPRKRVFSLPRGVRIIFGAGASGLVAALIIGSFSASGVIDMTLAFSLLGAALVVGIGAIIVSEPLLGLPPKIRWPSAIGASILLALIVSGIGAYEKAHFPTPPTVEKQGARFLFDQGLFAKGSDKIPMTSTNRGDVIARTGTRVGTSVWWSDHILTAQEEEPKAAIALELATEPEGGTLEFLPNGSRTVEIPVAVTNGQYEAVVSGAGYLYVFFAIEFMDEMAPPDRRLFATTCGFLNKRMDHPLACWGHNESRLVR
jgi:hypothetical protein